MQSYSAFSKASVKIQEDAINIGQNRDENNFSRCFAKFLEIASLVIAKFATTESEEEGIC